MFYSTCLFCLEESVHPLCKICTQKTRLCVHTKHDMMNIKIPGTLIPLYSVCTYRDVLKRLIKILKSSKLEQSTLLNPLINFSAQRIAEILCPTKDLIVVHLPERRFGLDSRRFLAKDFAHSIASILGSPMDYELLNYKNPLKSLFYTQQKERKRRVRCLFPPTYEAKPRLCYSKRRVLLVDDVCTTGESLRAAIRALESKNIKVCAAAVLADTPIDG